MGPFVKHMMKKIKDTLKYLSRKYLDYDPSLRKVRISDDFVDQKTILSKLHNVEIIFDVGANVGQTTQKYRKLFPEASVYGFEPFPEVFAKYLRAFAGDRQVHPENIALSNKNGDAKFFLNSLHYTNSLLPNNTRYTAAMGSYEPVATTRVKTETLDSYCIAHTIERIDILKMDVQGGELLVLEGAREYLRSGRITLIYAEVEFVPIYENQPLLDDLERFLKQYGYALHKIYNISSWDSHGVVAADAIFVRIGTK